MSTADGDVLAERHGGQHQRGRPGYDGETVLRHAIGMFIARGYDATSMGDLAHSLGISKSAIYHHFPSKESILAAALDEALDGLTATVELAASAGDGEDAYARLRGAVDASVRILLDHLPAVTLLLRVRGNSPSEVDALRRRRQVDARLTALVRAAVAEGRVRSDLPAEVISRLMFGTVNSIVEWYRADRPVDAEVLAPAVSALLFEGLGVVPAATADT